MAMISGFPEIFLFLGIYLVANRCSFTIRVRICLDLLMEEARILEVLRRIITSP